MTQQAALRTGHRDIIRLALPAVGSAVLQLVHRAVDGYFIREVGTDAVASITVSSISVWIFTGLGFLIGIGVTSLVGRYDGAKRMDAAAYVAGQGLRWALVVGVLSALIGWWLVPLFFDGANATDAVRAHGLPYARIYWTSGTLVLLHIAGDGIFRGKGDTKTPFLFACVSLCINAVLDPLLILGAGPIPALGVAGAAWATVVANVVGALLIVTTLWRRGWIRGSKPSTDDLRFHEGTFVDRMGPWGLDLAVLGRMTRVGLPTAIAGMCFNIVYLVILNAAEFAGGPPAQAALGIGHTGEGVAYVLGIGWSAAAASLVGRHLGAGDVTGANLAAWRCARQCGLVTFIWSIVMVFRPEWIANVFAPRNEAGTIDAETLLLATSYIFTVSFCMVPQAFELTLGGAFGGAGLTLPPMVIRVAFSLLRIPLAWWAVTHWPGNVTALWWVICLTAIVRASFVIYWFARGTWKTHVV